MKRKRLQTLGFVLLIAVGIVGCTEKPWDLLSKREQVTLDRILAHWETWVPAKKLDGTAPLINFGELYGGLGREDCQFLDRVRKINPKKNSGFTGAFLGASEAAQDFQRLEDQWITKNGKQEKLDPQYLPRNVFEAYQTMMVTMEQTLGRKLLVESGYRSPAYQLYTFLFYTPKHHYSLAETGHWVALPGYSEHGAPHRQAIDFINQEGINGEDRPEDFEALPEYRWLEANARRFGFVLSYPRTQQGITFEPWHWRYQGDA